MLPRRADAGLPGAPTKQPESNAATRCGGMNLRCCGAIGWEAGIRTPITTSRAWCPTVERPPSMGPNDRTEPSIIGATDRTGQVSRPIRPTSAFDRDGRWHGLVVEAAPEIPGRHGSVGPPRLADLAQPLGLRPRAQAIRPLHGDHDPQIADGQHVGPMQPEDQEHLRRPAANALDLTSASTTSSSGSASSAFRSSALENRSCRRGRAGRRSSAGSCRPRAVSSSLDASRSPSTVGTPAGHEGNHAAVDGRGRLGRELLAGDGANERREVVRSLSGSKATGAMPPNQRRQYWITTEENPTRALIVRRSHCRDHRPVLFYCTLTNSAFLPTLIPELLSDPLPHRPVSCAPACRWSLSARAAGDDSPGHPCGLRRAPLRWSTRARSPSDARLCHPCWQSRAASLRSIDANPRFSFATSTPLCSFVTLVEHIVQPGCHGRVGVRMRRKQAISAEVWTWIRAQRGVRMARSRRTPCKSLLPGQRCCTDRVETYTLPAQKLQNLVKARADAAAGDRDARRVDERAGLTPRSSATDLSSNSVLCRSNG